MRACLPSDIGRPAREGKSKIMTGIPEGFIPHPNYDGGFADLIGTLYSRREDDRLRFGFMPDASHTNAAGIVHGGRLMTFADQSLGQSVLDFLKVKVALTASLNCDFVSGAVVGQWVECLVSINRVASRLVFTEGKIMQGGKIVLSASGLWYRKEQ